MGVTGMKDLVKESKSLEDFLFQNSQVIIDGPNLYYSLYFNSNPKMDQRHGGDYPAFREQVRMFFTNLRRCNITALVVLDGGSEPGKEETVEARLKDKLQKAKRMSESSARLWDNILPPLVKDLFIQILQELQIEMEQCFGEADLTAVLRANERRCPVLSNDSDFYIFDVKEGLLSIDAFQWQRGTNGAIPARRYRTSQFCDHFKVDRNHLPVFAAISGNDYSRLEDRSAFSKRYPEPQLPGGYSAHRRRASTPGGYSAHRRRASTPGGYSAHRRRASTPGGYSAHRRRAILRFLAGFKGRTSEEAVRAALQLAGETKEEVIEHFLESTRKYALEIPPRPNLPEWIIHEVHRGRLTSFVTSVLTQKSMTLTPLVEDFSKPSSYNASLRIRQFFYGLLVGTQPCNEYDREGADAVFATEVTPVLPSVTPEDLQKLELKNLNEVKC
ncbi:hypothetical protein XENORESO_008302 [Xenotaenia resolanae]|uniref:Asteroid domain-containing protein n=1 Tax=Xenotaenia resolanae TaxID=208358 RepID=A0ABV0W3E5_9TELE